MAVDNKQSADPKSSYWSGSGDFGSEQLSPVAKVLSFFRETLAVSGPLAMILLLSLIMLVRAPNFFSIPNIEAVLVDGALYMVLAVGMTFVITAKGIDLSIGSILVLSGVVMAAAIKDFAVPVPMAMVLAVITGAILGAINGLLITTVNLPDFVVTLGTDLVYRGLALVYASGAVFYAFSPIIVFFGRGDIGGIKMPLILGILAIGIGHIVYKHTRFGRHIHAVGGDRLASRRLGIPVGRMRFWAYLMCGALAGFAAIVITGRLDAITATQGVLVNLHTIAAVIIGGTSLFGGRGSIIGAALGALLLAMINNTMVILGFSFFYQQVAAGVVILLAVTIYVLSRGQRDESI
jgi:ribose transport system permease protein